MDEEGKEEVVEEEMEEEKERRERWRKRRNRGFLGVVSVLDYCNDMIITEKNQAATVYPKVSYSFIHS